MSIFIKRTIVTSETLGERLKKVREGRGIKREDIELETGIRGFYLKCLEEGDYRSLPGEVYVKNFLKVYGMFLGLDEEEIAEQYEKERRADDYKKVAQYAAGGRDLFGNKPKGGLFKIYENYKFWKRENRGRFIGIWGFKKANRNKISVRNIVISQIFFRGIIALLILGVFFYLAMGIKGVLAPPDLTIFEPVDNLVVNEPRVMIKGRVEGGAALEINDSEAAYDEEGNFLEAIDLHEGLNEIKISAKKAHSPEAVVWRRIMVE